MVLTLVCAACVDPGAKLDEFGNRVVDASTNRVDAEVFDVLPDITGDFLLALDSSLAPGAPMYYIATNVLTQRVDGGDLTVSMQPLTYDTRTPVGDPTTLTPNPTPVSLTGEFSFAGTGVVDGAANPISGTTITVDFVSMGIILDENRYCGTTDGDVIEPITLNFDGSTFGAVRIEAGQTPADVTALLRCPMVATPDAGVPDASEPDAAPPDAAPPDAAPPDAAPSADAP